MVEVRPSPDDAGRRGDDVGTAQPHRPGRERRFEIEFLDAGAEAYCFTFG